jgi:glycosyltransferase involved in cell wall biosynthesis
MQVKKLEKKVNLTFILCGLSYGGAERFTLDLIKSLDKEIFNIHLITIKGGGELLGNFRKTGIKIKLFNKKSKLGLKTIWQISKYLRKEKIDIVHTQLFAGDTWGRIAAWFAGIPIIISTEQNVNKDERRLKKIIKKMLSFITARIIAISEAVKDYQVEMEKISKKKIEVVYNGIDLNNFPFTADYHFNRQEPILGIIGRLEPQKGHLVSLRALNLVVKNNPRVKLIIMGQGSQENIIRQEAQRLGIEGNIIWQKPQDNVLGILKKIDLLVVPSLWEGLGIVILEAQAAGIPVVASSVDGIKEIINEKNGFLFEKKDYQKLAEIINRIIEKPFMLEGRRTAGRKTVEEKFDIKKIAQRYQNIYLNLYENIIG